VTIDWAAFFFALWGAFWLLILIFDPGKVAQTIFETGRQFRLGPFRYGIWVIAKTKDQFRVISGVICVGLIVVGLIEGISFH
jgi:hypothetical protein